MRNGITGPPRRNAKPGPGFLNPCEEWDYGLHIFEDPITHELFGKTEAGKYHVKALRLNRETFVWERRERAKLIEPLNSPQILPPSTPFEELRSLIRDIKEHLEILVPEIPYGLTLKNPETGEH